VVNCSGLVVDEDNKSCQLDGKTITSGQLISIDGKLGNIYKGHYGIEQAVDVVNYQY
jgi:phosphohistidine swiveling domain-containing protein